MTGKPSNDIFLNFLNKAVTVIYGTDLIKRMTGRLEQVKDGFIFVQGDYTSKLIPISDVREIKEAKGGGLHG